MRWSSPERSEALARAPERIAAPTARSALDAPAPSLSAGDDGPTTKSPAPPETDRGASPAPLAGGLIATRPRVVPGGSAEQIAGRAAPRAAPAAGRPDEAIAAPRVAPRSAVRAAGVEAEPAPALVAALPVGGTAEPGIRAPRERSLPRSSPGVLAAPAAAALEIGRARGPGRGDIADALIPLSSTPGSPLALPGGGRETAPVSPPSIRPSATVSAEPRRGLGGGEVASKIPLLPPPPTATAFEASTVVASETEPADAKPLTPFPIVRVRQSPRVVLELARAILPPAAAAQVAPSIAQQAVQAGERDDPLGSQSPAPAIEPSRSLGPSSAKALAEPHSTKPGSLSAVAIASSFVPKIYQLRTASRREEAIRQGGGSEETERAVALGLRWLALHQSPDGRWDLRNFMKHLSDAAERDRWHPDWDGRGRNDSRGGTSRAENGDMGATGLALLAFLGHGDTHLDAGPYQENVRRGFHFLLSHQLRDGDLRDGGNLYMHALSSFAICEAYALTRDPALEAPARRAIGFTLRTQNPDRGGWRYEPYPQSEDVDTSVFGWMLMAIKSARIAGIEIDARAVARMERYLDSVRMTRGGGRYAYQPGLPRSSIAMTAQGFFCQQILAELKPPRTEDERTRVRRAAGESVSLLLAQRPEAADQDGANAYYWYYATLALFQEGGAPWERWNSQLKEVLLKLQLGEDQGSAAGSWDPIDRRAQLGGRVYSTAMGILCLEVYYRYAPRESGK
ncbi:MAG TPA: hypothetical protein VFD71_14555 [Planctomycetota bacterium]|nr:hypothetical protein [Planctomycetota bacterium]